MSRKRKVFDQKSKTYREEDVLKGPIPVRLEIGEVHHDTKDNIYVGWLDGKTVCLSDMTLQVLIENDQTVGMLAARATELQRQIRKMVTLKRQIAKAAQTVVNPSPSVRSS